MKRVPWITITVIIALLLLCLSGLLDSIIDTSAQLAFAGVISFIFILCSAISRTSILAPEHHFFRAQKKGHRKRTSRRR